IDLDAPIGRYLPGIVRFADSTTVRHLLSHTSGIYDYQEDPQFIVEAYEDPEHLYEPAEMVAMADQVGIVFRPGTRGAWRYSSTNYVILGMLVEQVTGRTLAEELHTRIFEPLGLTHTFFTPYDDLEATPAQGYIGAADRVVLSMTFVYGTANIVSTADDLRRFTDALFGGRLITPPSLAMMTTLGDTGGAFAMPELEYGLGVMGARMSVRPGPDGRARPDEVTTVLGHIGGIAGFRSAAWWAPESGITIALSLNQADIDPNILARDVFDAILTWQGR
ncbi:MAG TPA: serine hydrolase domain-containing protein, partial [Herpetosiphonaceae bacterium]|nr:serine hydrolase domain-containing protein [Herpetosiphonaceae bacterium]